MRTLLGVVVVATLLAAACSGDDAEPDVVAPAVVAETTPEPNAVEAAPTPTAPAVDGAVIEIGDRSVTYGGVIFTPLEAEISNEDPTSRENGLGLPSTETYLHLTIGVRNPMAAATLTLDDRRFFSLRVDGVVTAAPLLSDDIAPRSAVRPGAEGTMRASWQVPDDFELADGALVVGPVESQQAVLPLAGFALDTTPRLRAVPVSLSGLVDGTTVCGPTRLQVADPVVTLSVDLPADVADTSGLPRRAFVDQTFVEATVAFTVVSVDGSDECSGTIVSADLVGFTSDGSPAPDGWVDGEADVAADVGDTVVITVGTMVRQGAEVRLSVGDPEGAAASAGFVAG